MLISTKAIVLSKTPYSDKYALANLLTNEAGFVTYRIPLEGRKNSLADRLRRMVFPLSELHLIADHRETRNIQTIRDASPSPIRLSIIGHPVKRDLCFFLADVLNRILRHSSCDPNYYNFISTSLNTLEGCNKGIENFHIAFLFQLLTTSGVAPKWQEILNSFRGKEYFSLSDVSFSSSPRGVCLSPPEATFLKQFARINYRNMHLYNLSRNDRRRIIELLLYFYRIHVAPFGELKSNEVLHQLYSIP